MYLHDYGTPRCPGLLAVLLALGIWLAQHEVLSGSSVSVDDFEVPPFFEPLIWPEIVDSSS